MASMARGEGPKLLSFAPSRSRNVRPLWRCNASGATNGTVAGNPATSGVGGIGRWDMVGSPLMLRLRREIFQRGAGHRLDADGQAGLVDIETRTVVWGHDTAFLVGGSDEE